LERERQTEKRERERERESERKVESSGWILPLLGEKGKLSSGLVSGFGVWGSGRIRGSERKSMNPTVHPPERFITYCDAFDDEDFGFQVQDLGFRVEGSWFRVSG